MYSLNVIKWQQKITNVTQQSEFKYLETSDFFQILSVPDNLLLQKTLNTEKLKVVNIEKLYMHFFILFLNWKSICKH